MLSPLHKHPKSIKEQTQEELISLLINAQIQMQNLSKQNCELQNQGNVIAEDSEEIQREIQELQNVQTILKDFFCGLDKEMDETTGFMKSWNQQNPFLGQNDQDRKEKCSVIEKLQRMNKTKDTEQNQNKVEVILPKLDNLQEFFEQIQNQRMLEQFTVLSNAEQLQKAKHSDQMSKFTNKLSLIDSKVQETLAGIKMQRKQF